MEKLKNISNDIVRIIFGVKVEDPKVWIMQRLIFLLILTLLLIKPTANAIFLSKVGVEALPIAYLMVAFIALIFTLFYNKYITKLSPLSIFYASTKMCIVALVIIGIILWVDGLDIFGAYLFYLFISIFGILSASQFWILANQIFNAREARKYFGIIGFGAIAGGIVGGYLASIISTILQSEVIPFVAAIILIFVLNYIKRFSTSTKEKGAVPIQDSIASNLKAPIQLILSSKHLTLIALVIAISVFTSKLIDFQFGYFAALSYPIEEDLTSFYGFMYSTFNLAAIAIQMLLTTRIIGRLGIGYSLILLPVILVINAGILIFIPGLLLAGGIKMADASMKQSINKAAIELIMLPVPKDIKLRTKTFLDVFIDSIATGVSGIVLLLVLQAFDLANWIISLMILIASIIWLLLANKIRQEYKRVFRQSLNVKSEQLDIEGKTIEESYKNILQNGIDSQVLKTLTFLQDNPMKNLENSYLTLLRHENPFIVKAAIELLTYIKSDYSDDIIPLLNHTNQNVSIAAFEYMINHQNSFGPNFLIDRLNSSDLEVKLIALVAYIKEFRNDPRSLNILRVQDRLQNIISTLENEFNKGSVHWVGVLKAIGYGRFSSLYTLIDDFMDSDHPELRKHSILAAGETQSSHFLKKLSLILETTNPDPWVIKSLSKFSMSKIEKVISSSLKNDKLNTLRNIPKVLELKPNQKAILILQSFFGSDDIELRSNAIIALRVLSDNYPLLKVDSSIINKALIEECKYTNKILEVLSMYSGNTDDYLQDSSKANHPLINLLKHKIDSNLKLIFELLHIKYPPENYLELYDYVKGADTELRNNAIEYVDNSLTFDLKTAIIPLLEYISSPEQSKVSDHDTSNRRKIRDFLLKNKDASISEAAIDFYK